MFKYVIFDNKHVVITGKNSIHAAIDYCDKFTDPSWWERSEPTSAGFGIIFTSKQHGGIIVECYGRSESLDLDSDPKNDAILVREALGL